MRKEVVWGGGSCMDGGNLRPRSLSVAERILKTWRIFCREPKRQTKNASINATNCDARSSIIRIIRADHLSPICMRWGAGHVTRDWHAVGPVWNTNDSWSWLNLRWWFSAVFTPVLVLCCCHHCESTVAKTYLFRLRSLKSINLVWSDIEFYAQLRAYFSVHYYTKCVLLKAGCATLKRKVCNIKFLRYRSCQKYK